MALGIYEEEDVRAIANSIRNQIGTLDTFTVKNMVEGVERVAMVNHNAGLEAGFFDGFDTGRRSGLEEGFEKGKNTGYAEGLEKGKEIGYEDGKTDGIAEGVEQGKTEANAVFENANSDLENILYGEQRGYPVQSNMSQAKFDLYEIGEAIRERGVTPSKTTEGYAENIGEIYGAGRKSQYDEFWDNFQDYGKQTDYLRAFASKGWNDKNFKPKYDIRPTGSCIGMFDANTGISDLKARFDECGVVFDTSKITNFSYFITSSKITRLGIIDTTSAPNLNEAFYYSEALETIEKLVLREDGTQTFRSSTSELYVLKNLIVEGTIGQNGFNVQWSTKLSKASITSIINALSTTTSGLTVTISKTAVNNAFNGGSEGDEWLNLVATKNNWTISLV